MSRSSREGIAMTTSFLDTLESFVHYPELKWMAKAAGEFFSGGDKFQINPDLLNFKLERFVDLRKQSEPKEDASSKLMLIGSSKTNVFVFGPDDLINALITKLQACIEKPWSEIIKIQLECRLLRCENFLVDNKCHPWVIDKFEMKEVKLGQEIPYNTSADLIEVDKICAKCSNFFEKRGAL